MDPARNYFVLLGLLKPERTYQQIIFRTNENGKLDAAFFLRRSGNAQLCISDDDYELDIFSGQIRQTNFKTLITAKSYSDRLAAFDFLGEGELSAEIAILDFSATAYEDAPHKFQVERLSINDLDEVIELYKHCFHAFSDKSVMEEKLRTGRGRGILIRQEGRLVSCAQSEFETKDMALIVGVATAQEFRGRGFAGVCVRELIDQLHFPGRKFALQYDNPDAGRLYKRLGFRAVDRIGHFPIREDGIHGSL